MAGLCVCIDNLIKVNVFYECIFLLQKNKVKSLNFEDIQCFDSAFLRLFLKLFVLSIIEMLE